MWGARSKLDTVSCSRIAEKSVPSSTRLRRIAVAIALVAVVAASLSAAGTAAASENGAVYVNESSGYVEFIDQEGTRNATDQQANVVGTAVDLDDDGNDQYVYPGDEPAPSVEILEPVDAEYEDEVTLKVRAESSSVSVDEWYYRVDGDETGFDGSPQSLTGLSRGSHTVTVRAVNAGEAGKSSETFRSETFQVARADPDEAETAPQTTPRTATPTPRTATPTPRTAATATPAPTATPTPTPTPATAPAATPTPTTTPTTVSTSTTAATGAEQAGSLNWVFPLLVLVTIAIAVVAVRRLSREE